MENVTIFSPMNLIVKPMLHVALMNIPVIQWSGKHTLENDVQQNFEKLCFVFLGYDI